MSELIKNYYYVVSHTSGKIYKINKDLCCTCKGYEYRRTCKHVKEVIKDINAGKFVPSKNLVATNGLSWQGSNIVLKHRLVQQKIIW